MFASAGLLSALRSAFCAIAGPEASYLGPSEARRAKVGVGDRRGPDHGRQFIDFNFFNYEMILISIFHFNHKLTSQWLGQRPSIVGQFINPREY
jgi:hypothetical protein